MLQKRANGRHGNVHVPGVLVGLQDVGMYNLTVDQRHAVYERSMPSVERHGASAYYPVRRHRSLTMPSDISELATNVLSRASSVCWNAGGIYGAGRVYARLTVRYQVFTSRVPTYHKVRGIRRANVSTSFNYAHHQHGIHHADFVRCRSRRRVSPPGHRPPTRS